MESIILHKKSWGRLSIPMNDDPFENPLLISILNKEEIENVEITYSREISDFSNDDYIEADILILSPEPGSINRPDEIVLAVSLFNADVVDTNSYSLLINGEDFTNQARIDGGILTLVPNQLSIGEKKVILSFKTSYGLKIKPIEWSFRVTKEWLI